MIESEEVFAAVRRGYTEFADATPDEIRSYFSDLEQTELVGHISNIKGILFEQEVVDALNDQGYSAAVFEATNHPATDIKLMDDEEVIAELQLKATDSAAYISNTLEEHPDIPIITTHEVAQKFDDVSMVYDSGLDNSVLTDAVQSTLVGATDSISDSSSEVADAVVAFLEPVQKKYAELRSNEDYLLQVFRKGADKARIRASQTLKEVQKTIGFIVKD